ncbi:MAG: FecR domain-containing protein [Sphingobacteriales bacterium JAD_PAG50586_3]|nr:MAG: FecR domain-containing protein [Sphingobacteriales bacterium JAD_PAG50586_3]
MPFVEVDTNAAWAKLKQRMDEGEEAQVVPMMTPVKNKNRLLFASAAAASVAILIGLFVFFKYYTGTNMPVNEFAVATQNTTATDTLPDGSVILLNKKSDLKYAENSKGERTVKLKGEAFFEVKHDEKKPFVVQVSNAFVKDIGTGFNVKEDIATNTVTVVVETGVVDFYTADNKGITLKAGETGIYNGNTKAFAKQENESNPNALSYKTKLFNFNRTTLGVAIAQLNNVYGSNIVLDNENLKNCLITVDFNNENLDTIIDVITATLNINSRKEGEKIILYGNGC